MKNNDLKAFKIKFIQRRKGQDFKEVEFTKRHIFRFEKNINSIFHLM